MYLCATPLSIVIQTIKHKVINNIKNYIILDAELNSTMIPSLCAEHNILSASDTVKN